MPGRVTLKEKREDTRFGHGSGDVAERDLGDGAVGLAADLLRRLDAGLESLEASNRWLPRPQEMTQTLQQMNQGLSSLSGSLVSATWFAKGSKQLQVSVNTGGFIRLVGEAGEA